MIYNKTFEQSVNNEPKYKKYDESMMSKNLLYEIE